MAFDKNKWMESFETLPEEKREHLRQWFVVQAMIMENLQVSEEEWFGLIYWAMEHPFDFSFVDDFPDEPRRGR